MQKLLFLVAVVLLYSCNKDTIAVSETEAQIASRVPNLKFQKLLNDTQSESNLYDYKEDFIILDFWATWCGPCLTAFPKMSDLQKTFKGKLKIIAVTDEGPERIEAFLKNRPQQFTVAIDEDKVINNYFKHVYIPHYVILDKNKKVVAITNGEYITKETIAKLIAGKAVTFKEKKENLTFDPNKPLGTVDKPIVYQTTLLPYNKDIMGMTSIGSLESNRLFAYNTTFTSMLRTAFQYSYSRTKEQLKNPEKHEFKEENRYSYEMIYPDYLFEERLELMKQDIEKLSGLKATIKTELSDVFVLQKIPNSTVVIPISTQLPNPDRTLRYGEGITLQGEPMERLRSYYEEVVQLPVVDETNYNKVYDIAVKWFEENPEQGLAELNKYGLELKRSKRNVDFLIITD